MNFKDLQQNWNKLGETDPLWAILSEPSKKNSRWNLVEFLKTGEAEIAWVMDYIASLPVAMEKAKALDFGCGIGRLTQPLCKFFNHCVGVDIAASMIHLAREYNQYGDRCDYYLNEHEDLRLFGNNQFDLIYSNITLQHMEPRYSTPYLREFLRILRVGGLAIFQVPSEPVSRQSSQWLAGANFAAQISVSSSNLSILPGAKSTIVVIVKNLGTEVWPAEKDSKYPIRLGNHWLAPNGEMVQIDDARAILDSRLKPTECVELSLLVTAPSEPGDYLLELDMVQESVAWFGNRGSTTVRVPVKVSGPLTVENEFPESQKTSGLHEVQSIEAPSIEMHCISREVVVETIASQGGRVVDIQEYGSAGADYLSYRYCITK